MSKRQGPPKHQNTYAWKPHLGQKINETVSLLPPPPPHTSRSPKSHRSKPSLLQEPGGRFRPLSEITGVCQRCRDQIDWKRRWASSVQLTC